MSSAHPIRNVLRIDNVETQPAERITANDEDRQHQGFDIQTVFAWPLRDGVLDVASALSSAPALTKGFPELCGDANLGEWTLNVASGYLGRTGSG